MCVCVYIYVYIYIGIYIYWIYILEYYSAIKNFAVCDDMDGAGVYYAKQNHSVKQRQIPYDFIHMWNLRNKMIMGEKERKIDF